MLALLLWLHPHIPSPLTLSSHSPQVTLLPCHVPPVMQYVSFVEITNKAVTAFADAGMPAHEAARYATFSFFLGVVATWLLGKLVDCLATAARVIQARKVRSIL